MGLDGDFVIWDPEAEIKGSICFLACPPRPDTKTLGVERTVPLQKQVLCVRGTRSQRTCAADVLRGHMVYDRQNGFDGLIPIGKLL